MIKLSVNVNKIATLRNARGGNEPNVLRAAAICIEAGCDGITVHPRPDGRHIRYDDVRELATLLRQIPGAEFNIEGFPSKPFIDLICEVSPTQCTLVPDPPDVLTSNSGWDLTESTPDLHEAVNRLRGSQIRTSLFLDPTVDQVIRAKALGADRIELYTERFARYFDTSSKERVYSEYHSAAEAAHKIGLGLNAGHDLDLANLPFLAGHLPGLLEVSIGHALICDALHLGLEKSVSAYLKALGRT